MPKKKLPELDNPWVKLLNSMSNMQLLGLAILCINLVLGKMPISERIEK